MERKYWPLFVLAAFVLTISPFPGRSGIAVLDFDGAIAFSKMLIFASICGVAYALAIGKLGLRSAVCTAFAAWFCCQAVAEMSGYSLRWLLPLPILGIMVWVSPFEPTQGRLANVPRLGREALALVGATFGSGILSNGLDGFRFVGAQFDYLEIWIGASLYAVSVAVLTTDLTRRSISCTLTSAYIACVALLAITLVVEMAGDAYTSGADLANLVICSLLLLQAWRFFNREDALLKIGETMIGGIIAASALTSLFETKTAYGPYWIVMLPFIALAVALAAVGLFLILSRETWLGRIVGKRGGQL